MKHTLEVNENGLFTIITEGDGNVGGIIAFLKDIISHPQWKPGNYILLDHRALKIDVNFPQFSGHLEKPNVYGQQEVVHCQRKNERTTAENLRRRPWR